MIFRHLMGVFAGILLVGCDRPNSVTDLDAQRTPYTDKAKQMLERQDYPSAAACYEQALLADPRWSRAHLELGWLYDDKLGDPIMAIYHYRRFLALQPDSDKRQLVEEFMERAKLSLAAKLPQSPVSDPGEWTRLQNERAALQQENTMLKARLTELEKPPTVLPPSLPPPPVVTTPTEPSRPKTHVVTKGDTLYSLAQRYYGTRLAWERIYQANSAVMTHKDQLRIGQELVLP